MTNSTLRHFILVTAFCLAMLGTRAQYITIPDANFATWLHTHGYDSCMVGNQLDTNCSRSFEYNATTLNLSHLNISDLTGLQYISWQPLSGGFNYGIDLSYNNLTRFPPQLFVHMHANFPITLSYNHIDTLVLDSNIKQISTLLADHNVMHYFGIDPSFGQGIDLIKLDLSRNNLSSFPNIYGNGYMGSPWILNVRGNNISSLPYAHLSVLDCGVNSLTSFLGGANLNSLTIDSNQLTTLDLNSLGAFGGLSLNCAYNHLTSITNLTATSMGYFICNDNNLTSIPHFPPNLSQLDCHNNPLLQCIPSLPNVRNFTINFSNTAVQCLPRLYSQCTYTSTPAITSVPTCDMYNNTYGCPQYSNLEGYVYIADTSHPCVTDSSTRYLGYIKAEFLKAGNIQQQIYSDWNGHYSFDELNLGQYTLQVDTSYIPISVYCPDSAYYRATVDSQHLYESGFNFGMNCKAGYDVGISGLEYDQFLPGKKNYITLPAGDISELYGLHCAAGISGQVQFTYSGPIRFVSMDSSAFALPPSSISGNTLTWNIADFGTVDIGSAFAMIFYTDSSAQLHDHVCFSAQVTPVVGDNNPANNNLYYCDEVLVAYDPNEKTVYPQGNIDTTVKWLTYTIHFQNTGTAPARHVKVTDTLDSHLDPHSFQLLNYSHRNITQIGSDGTVVFNFPNINLPDSGTSQSASKGYVQYRIRMKDGLNYGTYIRNTANIYFDFNSPVVTNTTVDHLQSSICHDTTVSVTATICASDSIFFNGHYIHTAGSYADTIMLAGGCDSITQLVLHVNPLPVVTLTWDSLALARDVELNYDSTAWWCSLFFPNNFQLKGGSPTGGVYSGSYVVDDTFSYNQVGVWSPVDTITYSYIDSNGCRGQAENCFKGFDCDGISNISNANPIKLYPNPNTGTFTLETMQSIKSDYTIYDVLGKVMQQQSIAADKQLIYLPDAPDGVYTLMVKGSQPVRFVLMRNE